MSLLFYDSNSAIDCEKMEKYGCDEMSPALYYAGTTDFESILDAIKKDEIPTNTGEIFSVVWKKDSETIANPPEVPNWSSSNHKGFINPISNLVNI